MKHAIHLFVQVIITFIIHSSVVTGAHGPKVLTIFASRPLNYEKRKIVLNM